MPSKPGRWRVFALAWILMTALSVVWSLATPIAASPDEPAHFIKAAAVASGQLAGEPSEFGHVVRVPRYVALTHARTCFAFNAEVTGACDQVSQDDAGAIVDGTTTAGLYNPLYYAAVGWPTTFLVGDEALYTMRFISGAFSSFFLALAITMVMTWRRPTIPVLGLVAGITPMMLFLSGSVNPNALEASSTVAVLAAMLSIVLHPRPELLAQRCAFLIIAASVAVNTRGLAMIWVLAAIVLPLLIPSGQRLRELFSRRPVQISVVVIAVSTTLSLLWLLSSSSLFAGLSTSDRPSTVPQTGAAPFVGFWLTLSGTFDFGRELVGLFGWLDTPANDSVYFVWAAFTSTLVGVACVLLRRRHLLVAGLFVFGLIFIPALIQGAYITGGGLIWQGRYTLPIYLCAMLGLAALVSAQLSTRGPVARQVLNRMGVLVLVLWALSQTLSFATTLRRYAVGTSGTWGDAVVRPSWNAPGGNLMLIGAFGIIAIATCAFLLIECRLNERGSLTPDHSSHVEPKPSGAPLSASASDSSPHLVSEDARASIL